MPTRVINFKALLANGVATLAETGRLTQFLQNVVEAAASDRWWVDADSTRFSLTKPQRLSEELVSAILTQQHSINRHLYDQDKRETSSELDSFADRLVFIDLKSNNVVIEWRQFRQQPPLTLRLAVRRIDQILSDLLTETGVDGQIALSPYEDTTKKEEFVNIFYDNRIIELEVRDFGLYPVDDSVVLVNPLPPLEGATRDLLSHDVRLNTIDKLTANARDNADADLKRAAITRAMLHSGQPQKITYVAPDGHIRVRREHEDGVFSVSVPVYDNDSASERAALTAQVVEAVGSIDFGNPSALPVRKEKKLNAVSDNIDMFNG